MKTVTVTVAANGFILKEQETNGRGLHNTNNYVAKTPEEMTELFKTMFKPEKPGKKNAAPRGRFIDDDGI